nr:non-canonical purine NTP pyrophosphatase [Aggregatilineales bacterium]
ADLRDVPDDRRTARFMCVVAVARPGVDEVLQVEGRVEGRILHTERGTGGFGYDALFQPDGHAQTFGELAAEVKDGLSHRGRAVTALKPLLDDLLR